MIPYNSLDPRAETGRLFSRMMVMIILLTTLALVAFGPQSITQEVFGGRTPSTVFVPAE
jgi:hypothetical protein